MFSEFFVKQFPVQTTTHGKQSPCTQTTNTQVRPVVSSNEPDVHMCAHISKTTAIKMASNIWTIKLKNLQRRWIGSRASLILPSKFLFYASVWSTMTCASSVSCSFSVHAFNRCKRKISSSTHGCPLIQPSKQRYNSDFRFRNRII